jgi:hypothetical protein
VDESSLDAYASSVPHSRSSSAEKTKKYDNWMVTTLQQGKVPSTSGCQDSDFIPAKGPREELQQEEELEDKDQEGRIPSTSDEEEVHVDKKQSKVTVDICQRIVLEKEDGSNIQVGNYTKKQCCVFCKALVSKIGRHLEDVHTEEPEVCEFMALKKKSKEKMERMTLLRNRGNFKHNIEVLKTGEGSIICAKRPTTETSYRQFYPCPSCLAFYSRHELWRHVRTCPFRSARPKEKVADVLADSRTMLLNIKTNDPRLAKLMSIMITDKVFEIISDDVLIKTYGIFLIDAHAGDADQHIRQKLRQLGTLVLLLRKDSENDCLLLSDVINPESFDLVIANVKTLGSNSLQLKLGSSLRKIAALTVTQSLRHRFTALSNEMRESCEAFMAIYDAEWSSRISKQCLKKMYDLKMNKKEELPLTSDLVKMTKKLKSLLEDGTKEVLANPTPANGRALSEAVLGRLIMFNKRRGGEQARMLLSTFLEVTQNTQAAVNEEIFKSLSPVEQKLAETHTLIKIIGKRGRHVPVLLPPDARQAMIALATKRKEIGILEENCYFFALPNKVNSYLAAWNVLNKLAQSTDLECPALIKSTRLRKYLATTSQIMALGPSEQEWLARHLGHDLTVHKGSLHLCLF